MIFQREYRLFDNVVNTHIIHTDYKFIKETQCYDFINRYTPYCKTIRVDTTDQKGFPDQIILNGDEYLMIESKLLKRKKLVDLKDNLEWQYGQLAFFKRCLTTSRCYLLCVAKDNYIAFIGTPYNLAMLDNMLKL